MFDGQMDGEVGRWVGTQACGCCSVRATGPPALGQAVLGSPGSWVGETDLTPKSPLATDHLSDLALPGHDHGKQVPGETRAQDPGEEHPPADLHLHQALLWTEGG